MNGCYLRGLLLVILCFGYYDAVCQVNPNLEPKIALPSPEAQAFMQYGAYPVDYSTGVPKIEIPLYDIKAGKLSLPISLSYHASGIKVNEIASSAGLGWSLRAGGMVSRNINNMEDENGFLVVDHHMTTAEVSNFPEEPADNPALYGDVCQEVRSLFAGGKDARSDNYSYSVGDKLSGQFVFDVNKTLQKLSYTNDSIIWKINGAKEMTFEIIGDDGTRYLFDEREKVLSDQMTGYWPTSWPVTQIISHDNADTIYFEYNHFAPFGYSIKSYSTDYRSGIPAVLASYSNMNYDASVLLKKIRYRGGSVVFNYEGGRLDLMDNRLSSIVINRVNENNVEEVIRSYQLVHNYFVSGSNADSKYGNRLKLTEVKTFDQSNRYINSYTFSYNSLLLPPMPNRDAASSSGNAQDYWGYFNGAGGNPHMMLIPANMVPYMGASAIRTTSEVDMKACSLERIDFPTGGYTKFEFEANKMSTMGGVYATGMGGLRIKKITSTADANAIPVVKQYEYLLGELVNDQTIGRYSYSQTTTTALAPPAPGGILNQNLISRVYYFSNSVLPIAEHSGSPILYTSVAEIMDDNNGQKQKTVYGYAFEGDRNYDVHNTLYGTYNYNGNSRYDEGYFADHSWARGQLLHTDSYKFNGTTYNLIKSENNEYISLKTKTINTGMIITEKLQDPAGGGYPCTYNHPGYQNFFYFDVLMDVGTKKMVSQQETDYDDNGVVLSKTTTYAYEGLNHLYPTTVTTAGSNGELIVDKTKYAQDVTLTGNPELARQRLLATNNVSAVLNRNTQRNSVQLVDQNTTYALFNGNKVYPSTINRQFKAGSIPTVFNFLQYDNYGNILAMQQTGSAPSAYIWGYKYGYPIAEVKNAAAADIAYTSFEGSYTASEGTQELGNWQSASILSAQDRTAPTGKKAAVLYDNGIAYTVYKQNLSTVQNYILSCWVKNGGNITISPSPSNTLLLTEKNGWKLYQYKLSGISSVTVSSATNQTMIDELRLYPANAFMTTYTFSSQVGMTSKCDENNRITYYEYDPFQRLSIIRDQNRNIIKEICYKYANGASTLCAGQVTYYNAARDSAIMSKSCGVGGITNPVVYTVPVSKYSSTVSQADADLQARNEIILNGQANANAVGICTYYNDTMSRFFSKVCAEGQTTIPVAYKVSAQQFSSSISKADANNIALNYINAHGQDYANTVGGCTSPNTIYAKIFQENVNPTTHTADIIVRFYSDYYGTIAKSVTSLPISYRKIVSSEDNPATNTDYSATATGTSITLLTGTTIQYYDSQIAGDWYVAYTLNSNSGYTIIY